MHIMSGSGTAGEVRYPDGSRYTGSLSAEDGLRQAARGTLATADGATYTGQFDRGMFHGLGSIAYKDGSKYSGEFVAGKYQGVGVFSQKDGVVYQGEFSGGKVSGKGRMVFQDGSSGQPRNEGIFDNFVLTKRQRCDNIVDKAIRAAADAER